MQLRCGDLAEGIMCGIAGTGGDIAESDVRSMIEVQRHRGPDGQRGDIFMSTEGVGPY